jgi:hypothetical protein
MTFPSGCRMRIALTASLVFVCAVAAAQDKPVEKYTSKEGKYAVQFPDNPMKSTSKAGGIDLNTAIVVKGMGGFAVIHADLPPEATKVAKSKELLDGGQKGLIDNFKAKVTSTKDFEFGKDKHLARELVAEKDQLHLRIRIVLVGNRIYQVFVVGPKDLTTSPDADAFFKSFEITE